MYYEYDILFIHNNYFILSTEEDMDLLDELDGLIEEYKTEEYKNEMKKEPILSKKDEPINIPYRSKLILEENQ